MRNPKAYISGAMSGCIGYNFAEFNRVAEKYRGMGWDVINPAELDKECGNGKPWEWYILRDLKLLADERPDFIVLINGQRPWTESIGSQIEKMFMEKLGAGVIYEK